MRSDKVKEVKIVAVSFGRNGQLHLTANPIPPTDNLGKLSKLTFMIYLTKKKDIPAWKKRKANGFIGLNKWRLYCKSIFIFFIKKNSINFNQNTAQPALIE